MIHGGAVQAVLVGAGSRGTLTYGGYARRFPQHLRIVAVAEPDDDRRRLFAEQFGIESARQFRDWRDLLDQAPIAPALINATGDRLHLPVTRAALDRGYHVIQEKPIASTPRECLELLEIASRSDRLLQIAHCLRFTPYYQAVHDIVQGGHLGHLMTVEYKESLSPEHMTHSFVRGHFSNEARSSPMMIAKSCHDLDILVWVIGRRCLRVSSFGSLRYFRPAHAPPGATARCTQGCPAEPDCPHSAIKHYIIQPEKVDVGYGPAQLAVSPSTDRQDRWRALESGPFGRCVFACDNDVVDHQVVNLEFEDGITVAFTMQGFGPVNTRSFSFFGSKACLESPVFGTLKLHEPGTGQQKTWQTGHPEGGHGGGDFGMLHNFVDAIQRGGRADLLRSSVDEAVMSHLIGFAAEESRWSGAVIDMTRYLERLRASDAP